MDYEPRPIPTDAVQLADELLSLVERLAEHNHDVWACERRNQGWTYGAKRDDVLKRHPCLVSYGALSESEKEIDRATVVGVLKAVTALGYRILTPAPQDV
jgi:hypothetical protein